MHTIRGILRPDPGASLPRLRPGMELEVRTSEGHLLFMGCPELWDGGELELRRRTGDLLPLVQTGLRIRLESRRDPPFALTGVVAGTTRTSWRVRGLEVLRDRRSSPRLDTDLDARIAQEDLCKLLDISAGGVRIRTERRYPVGAVFTLEVELSPPPFLLTCRVLRAVERDDERFEYGCRILELPERERDRLARAIDAMRP